jgi:hypothetical protein
MLRHTFRSLAVFGGLLHPTTGLRKKIGKPLETPDYKQAYLPYETAPTASELESKRRAFAFAPFWLNGKKIPVKDVPANMFTFGKEGMSVPISILKEQADPVIGPEWTYPGIYENKIAAKSHQFDELLDMEASNKWPSPWLKGKLENQVNKQLGAIRNRMMVLSMTEANRFIKEKGAAPKGKAASKAPATPADPDKKAAAAAKK